MSNYSNLLEDSKCWIFGIKEQASKQQVINLEEKTQEFLSKWKSHGNGLSSSFLIAENRFLIISAKDSSGCSIDSLRKEISSIFSELNLDLSSYEEVFWKDSENIYCSNREQFIEQKSNAKFVYDLSLSSTRDLKANKFCQEYEKSWAAKAFA